MTKARGFYRWFLQRFTGLLLALFLITHVVVLHFSGGSPVDFKIVVSRLANSFWLIFYVLFLTNTIFHALNGLYGVVEDYNLSRTLRLLLSVALWSIGLIAVIWGIYVLIAFRAF
ncbi:MAG: succinate dehydrogenase, hydrophobic membrane anchor protein [Planctomycetota bacterium]